MPRSTKRWPRGPTRRWSPRRPISMCRWRSRRPRPASTCSSRNRWEPASRDSTAWHPSSTSGGWSPPSPTCCGQTRSFKRCARRSQRAIRPARAGGRHQRTAFSHLPPGLPDDLLPRPGHRRRGHPGCLTHLVNLAEWIVGPADRVLADASHQVLEGVDVEDTVHLLSRHGPVMAAFALNQHQGPTRRRSRSSAATERCAVSRSSTAGAG